MLIHISRGGQPFGPYTSEAVEQYLSSGELVPEDLAWYEGAPSWIPLSQVPGIKAPGLTLSPPPAVPAASQPSSVYQDRRPTQSQPFYHHVSLLKFALLSLVSFGIYELFWFYRNWKFIRDRDHSSISPFWRTFFAMFWCYPLCKDVSRQTGGMPGFMLIIVPVAFLVLFNSHRLPGNYWLISLLSFVPLLYIVHRIDRLNRSLAVRGPYYASVGIGTGIMAFIGAALTIVTVWGSLFMPESAVISGDKLSRKNLAYLREKGILRENEQLQYFYSGGLASIQEGGVALTDQRVISYETLGKSLEIHGLEFSQIENTSVEYGKGLLENTTVNIIPNSKSDLETFEFTLATEEGGDKTFVNRLTEQVKAAKAAAALETQAKAAVAAAPAQKAATKTTIIRRKRAQ